MTDLNKHKSAALTEGPSRAAARAMLKACAFTDEDLAKPLVGIANTWTEIGPCNFHLRRLAEHVKDGVRQAGGTPMEFNTIAVSDGITMGAEGMRASLVSREVIADSIELVTFGHHLDAVVMLCGCDKTIPGTIMALARLNIPGVILYGGSIEPGSWQGKDVTIQDVFEGVGAQAAGRISLIELKDLEDKACPGAGACGGQFTANTMAMVAEFLGVAAMGSVSIPATYPAKEAAAVEEPDHGLLVAVGGARGDDQPGQVDLEDPERHRRERRDGPPHREPGVRVRRERAGGDRHHRDGAEAGGGETGGDGDGAPGKLSPGGPDPVRACAHGGRLPG